jgi:AcrR family transcriptional regulator
MRGEPLPCPPMPRPRLPRQPRIPRTRRPYAPRLPPEERREQLLDAALRLIIEQGYAGVSIEAVARIAGVTRPVVYDHFPNLGQLLRALVEREERLALGQLEQVVPDDPVDTDPPQLLVQGVRLFLDAVLSRPNTWRIILLPLDGTPAIIRDQVETNRARMQERIEALVRWAFDRPEFPYDLDVELTAQAVRHLAEEAGRMVLIDPDHFTPDRYVAYVESVLGLVWPHDGSDN